MSDGTTHSEEKVEVSTVTRGRLVLIVCLLALAVWVVFGQTLRHGFVSFDDNDYVYENPVIAQGFSWAGVVRVFTEPHAYNWHPVTSLSHMLDCELFGLNPAGHHFTNVLLHTAAVLMLFLVLARMTGALGRSAFVAAIFAIHPLRVESVAWVAERKDVLSGLFFMLTFWAYGRYAEGQGGKLEKAKGGAGKPDSDSPLPPFPSAPFPLCPRSVSSPFYLLALGFFALGLMSKPMLVTVPFVLLLLDYWPLRRMTELRCVKQLLVEKIPFLVLVAASSVLTLWAQSDLVKSVAEINFLSRIGNAVMAGAIYLWQLIWPVRLAVFYPHPGTQLPLGWVGLSALVLVIVSAGVAVRWRRRPYLPVGWLWYLIMLAPVSGLIQVGWQAHADRYTYLPHMGVAVMIAWGGGGLVGGPTLATGVVGRRRGDAVGDLDGVGRGPGDVLARQHFAVATRTGCDAGESDHPR